jgi:hypothetical protein
MALLDKVKTACRVTSAVYNDELLDLIAAALADMGITDIKPEVLTDINPDPLILRAIVTYCRMNFGYVDELAYERLKASYDEQKSQLLMSSTYSTFEAVSGNA